VYAVARGLSSAAAASLLPIHPNAVLTSWRNAFPTPRGDDDDDDDDTMRALPGSLVRYERFRCGRVRPMKLDGRDESGWQAARFSVVILESVVPFTTKGGMTSPYVLAGWLAGWLAKAIERERTMITLGRAFRSSSADNGKRETALPGCHAPFPSRNGAYHAHDWGLRNYGYVCGLGSHSER
jgi:hypothetical protein